MAAAAVAACLGVGGVSAFAASGGSDPAAVPVAAAEQARAEAAQRADRSDRGSPDAAGSASLGAAPTPAESNPTPAESAPAPTESAPAPSEPAPVTGKDAAPQQAPAADPPAQAQTPAATTTTAPDWVSPMPGAEITSCYGQRWGVLHAGIDLAKPAGTPIQAAGAGTVIVAGWAYTGYGISVVVDHGNGILTHYAHMSEATATVGDRVAPGDEIGREGSTGDSTGPHLHFEVHNGLWNQLDPGPWMRERGVDLGC